MPSNTQLRVEVMQFRTFKSQITKISSAELGGIEVQLLLAPSYRKRMEWEWANVENSIKAAVLILFFPDPNGEIRFLLTKRATYKGHHSNQISFPGGKKDKNDNTLLETALRETKEEVGIEITKKQIIKQLTDVYIPPSNFVVTPFLGILDKTPVFNLNYEVEITITPTLSQLLDDTTLKTSSVTTTKGETIQTPSFVFNSEIVWGATAMMLSELKKVCELVLMQNKKNRRQ